jgi:pSer/pThr/pTyr-binding forkhead associated (FHA) protein
MIEILIGQRLVALTKNIYVIGRDKSCDIQLSDSTISRRHATIYIKIDEDSGAEQVTITDGDMINDKPSANGLRINGVLLDPRYGQILNDGDTVELSPSVSFKLFCKKSSGIDEQKTDLL